MQSAQSGNADQVNSLSIDQAPHGTSQMQNTGRKRQGIDELVTGLVNNNVKVPQHYFNQTYEDKIKKKTQLLDQL